MSRLGRGGGKGFCGGDDPGDDMEKIMFVELLGGMVKGVPERRTKGGRGKIVIGKGDETLCPRERVGMSKGVDN